MEAFSPPAVSAKGSARRSSIALVCVHEPIF
ncbi:hypothetical protein I656_03598 [Geobacillus sp. WSUCF1]|nr:hypothetical protein I656_03598 [Geobacillus sp. WSUCF1]